MLLTIAFVFTMAILIIATFKFVGLIFGNSMSLPPIIFPFDPTPDHGYVLYPSLMFQVWFWADKLGVI